ncbi:MAG TPA: hypothetical protein PKU80_09335 [Candidatus Limiplasma sp.]|nr:hypothetical protein [Candidatus Limiplasma sp.]HRX08252.1 hypothetical protein [Candidatus Limiplasma sp.]
MSFLERLKYWFRNFMAGRYGADRLSMHMLWLGVGLILVSTMLSSAVLNIVSFAIYALAIARILSKNTIKRSKENLLYVNKMTQIKKAVAHRRNRFKNRKQYRYFKCPNCKAWLRVPRKAGQVKVTCGNCGHKFSYIAK